MAKVFLDANVFFDVVEGRDPKLFGIAEKNTLYISVSSIGIWAYVFKHPVPNKLFDKIAEAYNFVDQTSSITFKAFSGPTNDFEDNIQLHSSSECSADLFVTKDEELLKLGYFGKVRICPPSEVLTR